MRKEKRVSSIEQRKREVFFTHRHQSTGLSYSIQSCKFPREDKLKDKNTQDDSKRSDRFTFLNLWRELFVPYSFVVVLHGSKTPPRHLT
jgi:hypothetical protein